MTVLFWLRYITRSLRRGGSRALFAALCVTVGVAGVVALQTATLTVQAALTANIRAANGGDISVVSTDNPIPAGQLHIFSRLQQSGRISQWTAVSSLHATAVGPAHSLVPFEINVVQAPPYPLGGQPTFVTPSNGQVDPLLTHAGDVLITTVLADELGAHIGDRLLVNSIGGQGLHATVRGIVSETSFDHSAIMTVNHGDLAVLSSRPAQYTEVFANTNGNATAVAGLLRRQFPVATVQTVQEALQATQAEVHDFRQFMLLVGLLALLIAGIGILNAMQSILTWRRLEIAMLRAMGYRQSSLYLLFGGEAILLGLLGGIAGTIVGAVGSKLISDALARALALQVNFQFDGGTLLAGIGLGIGATLVFAVLPIVRAANFRPLELLREGSGTSLRGIPQTVALLALVVLLFAALAAIIMGDTTLAFEFVAGAAGACAILAGIFSVIIAGVGRLGPVANRAVGIVVTLLLVALTVLAVRRVPAIAAILALATVLWAMTVFLPPPRLLTLLMAVRSLSRRRARTSVTLVAFLVGVLAMSVTLTVALSLRSQINNAISGNGSGNLVAVANGASVAPVLREAATLPGVRSHTLTVIDATTPTAVNGAPATSIIGPTPRNGGGDETPGSMLGGVAGIDLRRTTLPAGLRIVGGRALSPADIGTANVVVRSRLRDFPWRLRLGDRVTLSDSGSGLSRTVRVVGFYGRQRGRGLSSFFLAPVIGDLHLARSLGRQDAQSIVSFTVSPDNLTTDAATLQRTVPGVLVLDVGDLTRVVETVLNELLNVLAVITALSLGAGVAVVANGVALSMLERRREIALLKAIGFGPRQVMRFVLAENALAGTLAGALSVLAVAIALAVLSHVALNQAIGFDPVTAVLVLVIATTLAISTAYLAARRPISVRPLEVLRNE